MKILLAIEDLRIGGAQVFALRLAQALHQAGHQVRLFSHYAHHTDQNLVKRIAPDVPVEAFGSCGIGGDWLLRKTEGLLRRFGRQPSLRAPFVARRMRRIIATMQPDVVNTHTIYADYVASLALKKRKRPPLVITMHGCYELFLHKHDGQETIRQGKVALHNAQAVVYLTDKNLQIFQLPGVSAPDDRLRKIYNGFAGKFSEEKQQCTREALHIPADAFVFGMVARGIAQKGWGAAVNSFERLSADFPQAHLVLVGHSDYLAQLKARHRHPRIHFIGFSRNPIDWVDLFDVGLLPSYFHAESLPNSIAEYLFCGKPVIASLIGEVPTMLDTPMGTAGIIIDQYNFERVDEQQLEQAMRAYLSTPTLLDMHRQRALQAFEKFRMTYCLDSYEAIFRAAIVVSRCSEPKKGG
ncbi:glycosyltransferase family 4 protein [Hymenobacter latericus]|uniref:glycosyltransferase family 4 protein n=1 Tax=Hymenobacter sp. YIM 151858-1 TaxID=2987688 RepID=UPI002226653A|nr:glycosyltransferase family 4 protein [Hymenobacter sp. YIM 151858-1]UYZ57442.1 glycosyltransferase family 4 protein [Hymenobacter sp. YIM 151858-1]